MCLRLKQKFPRVIDAKRFSETPLIASRNLTVYKVLDLVEVNKEKEYYSTYRSTQYREGETKEVPKFSFKITSPYKRCAPWSLDIHSGLHSFRKIEKAYILMWRDETVLIKCTIPKGTPYFKNEDTGEYVSLKLQMPKEFKSEKRHETNLSLFIKKL